MYAPGGTWWYKKLNKKWIDEGKLRMAIDPNETRKWAKNCKRVWFDNITIEEMLDGFIDYSNELGSSCFRYISQWSERDYKLTEQRKNLRKKELEKYKEQVEDLKEEVIKVLNSEIVNAKDSLWEKEELKELVSKVKNSKSNEFIFKIIKKLETDAKVHYEALGVSEAWNKGQKIELIKEYNDVIDLLDKADGIIKDRDSRIGN